MILNIFEKANLSFMDRKSGLEIRIDRNGYYALYSCFAVEEGITGQLLLWTHELQPVSSIGTDAKQRGQRAMNGLVISIRHCGQLRTSSFCCCSRVVGIL
ncbi:MAG: hypothetical protein NTX44_04390 [Ignavibacteriales bacterium]|nr:hypothetical protein [Ignavibacteriales bacterium]